MGDDNFNYKLLTDKLSKLNSSQQSIESVSKWCISYRKKAKQVVETWEKLIKSAPPQQQVSFLYLSNDILQNSRRKGSEFVNEFWKVLPAALKNVYDGGNENGRKVALRLIDIFEERKVFGSRGQNLKSEVLGKNPSPANAVKSLSPPIKVVKRDATSLRVKLPVGDFPEKILTAMQLVHDEVANEEAALSKCHDAVSRVWEIEKDVLNASPQGNLHAEVIDDIEKHENTIQQCISKLEKSEEIRAALVSELKEALQDQESKLEQIRSELLVARGHIEQAANIRLQVASGPLSINHPQIEPTFPPPLPTGNPAPPPPHSAHPVPIFSTSTADDDSKRVAAAAVAAKLAASTSSAQMLTSILSSLVAEEAASVTSGLKRPRLEAEGAGEGPPASAYFTNMPPFMQAQPLPPPPPPPPPQPELNQAVPPGMMGVPFNYGGVSFALGPGQPGQLTQPPQQGQQPASGGYFRPVGVGFYGQPPPVHRQ